MSEHTPGPWRVVRNAIMKEHYSIAHMYDTIKKDRDEQRANANLIAAAPELLSLLESWAAMSDYEIDSRDIGHAERLIARAKGQSS